MSPTPKLYTAIHNGESITQGANQWAVTLGVTSMTVRRHIRMADGDMQKAVESMRRRSDYNRGITQA